MFLDEGRRRVLPAIDVFIKIIAVLCASWIALLSFVYAFIAYPQADDLERTAAMRFMQPHERVWSDYIHNDGRWASLFVQYFCYWGEHVDTRYCFMLTIPLFFGLLACILMTALLSGSDLLDRSVVAGGLIAYAVAWVALPWGGEITYWFPGIMGYWLPIAMGMIVLWLLGTFRGSWVTPIVLVLALLGPACHEVCGGWIAGVLAVVWFVTRRGEWPHSRLAGVASLVAVASTASVLLSPGTTGRAEGSRHLSIGDAFHRNLNVVSEHRYLCPAVALALLVVLLRAARSRCRPTWFGAAPPLVWICLAGAAGPLPLLMLTAVTMTLGGVPPDRLYDGIFLMTALAAATFAAMLGFRLSQVATVQRGLASRPGRLMVMIVMVGAFAAVVRLPRFAAAYKDIPVAMQARDVVLQRAAFVRAQRLAGEKDILVPYQVPAMVIIKDFPLRDNSDWYLNQHLASYFAVRSLRLADGSLSGHLSSHVDRP